MRRTLPALWPLTRGLVAAATAEERLGQRSSLHLIYALIRQRLPLLRPCQPLLDVCNCLDPFG